MDSDAHNWSRDAQLKSMARGKFKVQVAAWAAILKKY